MLAEGMATHVERYDLFLDVFFRDLRFDGKLFITLESKEDVVLDSVGLRVSNVSGNGKTFDFEEKVRLLVSMATFKEPRLLSQSLELAQKGEIKKQDQITMIGAATRNPYARQAAWTWIKLNISYLKETYEGTGDLSQLLQFCIPILGIGRVEETERYFDENRVREAQNGINAGLEKLKIYQRLVNSALD
jgi:aminopeptidase N